MPSPPLQGYGFALPRGKLMDRPYLQLKEFLCKDQAKPRHLTDL